VLLCCCVHSCALENRGINHESTIKSKSARFYAIECIYNIRYIRILLKLKNTKMSNMWIPQEYALIDDGVLCFVSDFIFTLLLIYFYFILGDVQNCGC